MAMSAKPKGQHGGARPGSGQKPSEAKVLRTAYLNTLHMDAVAASEAQRKLLDHLVSITLDTKPDRNKMRVTKSTEENLLGYSPILLELLSNVAEKIQNRAWGRPTQLTPEGDQPKGLILDL